MKKIYEDEFVDFADLIYPESKRFGVVLGEGEKELNLISRKGKALSEAQWFQAFTLFAIAYLKFFPDACTDLLLYAVKIAELMQ